MGDIETIWELQILTVIVLNQQVYAMPYSYILTQALYKANPCQGASESCHPGHILLAGDLLTA